MESVYMYEKDSYYLQHDGELSSTMTREPVIDQVILVSFVLAVLSCLLNLLIVITLWGKKLKAHLKFVLSLTFSDLLLSLCHVVMKFRKFTTYWNPTAFRLSFQNFGVTENSSFINSIGFPLPTVDDPTFLNFRDNNGEKALIDLARQISASQSHLDESDFNNTVKNISALTAFREKKFSRYTDFDYEPVISNIPDNILASLYLIPNITAPLAMLFITLSLLITVVKPLHVHIILSKRRGTFLVLTFWGTGLLAAGTTLGLIVNKPIHEVSTVIFNATLLIWYGTLICFAAIPLLYVAIITIMSRAMVKSQSRVKSHLKATVTAFLVTITFAACNLPFIWMFAFSASTYRVEIMSAIFQTLFMANTIFDPIIYAVRLPEVQEGLGKISSSVKKKCISCKMSI